MTYQPFLIAPFNSGLDLSVDPWLAPDDAIVDGINFSLKNGVIEKRQGYSVFYTFPSGESIVGIFQYVDNTGVKQLVVVLENSIQYFNTVTRQFVTIAGSSLSGGKYDYYNAILFPAFPNRLYFLNGSSPLQYYDGTNVTVPTLTLNSVGPARSVTTAGWVFFYGSRMVILSTVETDGAHPQRARWSNIEDPSDWVDDTKGHGGYTDATTGDFIVGAKFLRDTLVVFFEKSIWILRRNSNRLIPFIWEKINDTKDCDTSYGIVGFDKYIVALGKTGIIACDGTGSELIDKKIPYFVQRIRQSRFPQIYGYRHKIAKETWWSYANSDSDDNNRVLMLSEQSNSWGLYDFAITCFGDHEASLDPAWDNFDGIVLPEYSWEDFDSSTWNSSEFDLGGWLSFAGTIDGRLLNIDLRANDAGDPIKFEVIYKQANPFSSQGNKSLLGFVDFLVDTDAITTLSVDFRVDGSDYACYTTNFNCLPNYINLSDISFVSNTNPCSITSGGHGLNSGDSIYIYNVKGTSELNGINYTVTVVDSDTFTLDGVDATGYGAYVSGGTFLDKPISSGKVWKRAYAGVVGNFHQVRVYHEEANQPVKIHAAMPWFKPAGRLQS